MMSFKIPADAEALLRAYATETDRTMSDVLVELIRSLASKLDRLHAFVGTN